MTASVMSPETTVFADLVWAFWRSRIPRDADSLISLVSVEVRHLRCRSNLIHKAALGLLGTCVELMIAGDFAIGAARSGGRDMGRPNQNRS